MWDPFGIDFEPVLNIWDPLGIDLEPIWNIWDRFGIDLESIWNIWDPFRIDLEPILSIWDHARTTEPKRFPGSGGVLARTLSPTHASRGSISFSFKSVPISTQAIRNSKLNQRVSCCTVTSGPCTAMDEAQVALGRLRARLIELGGEPCPGGKWLTSRGVDP